MQKLETTEGKILQNDQIEKVESEGKSFFERELLKEMQKNKKRFQKVTTELRGVVDDLGFYNDENKQAEKVMKVNSRPCTSK